MAKQISQETFDDVVKENMEDFEMTAEEAIEDAVKQFESQGVNLTMIVKDASLYSGGGDSNVHPIIKALETLSLSVTQDENVVSQCMDTIQTECDQDLAHRVLAGKNKAFPVLVKALKSSTSNLEVQKKILAALCSLCNGQPDLIDSDGVSVLIKLLQQQKQDEETMELAVKLIRLNCIKHEMNRRAFVKEDLIQHLVTILELHKSSPAIVKEVSFALRVLTFDDDIRVPFGSAHENAKTIVLEGNALRTLLEICKDYTADTEVQGELFSTLGKLVVRNEFCKEVMDLGGISLIMTSLQTNMSQKGIVRQALGVLKALAGNDDIKDAIVAAGGVELVVMAMTLNQGNPAISAVGCQVLATLVLRKPEHCQLMMNNNAHHVILQAMKVHPQDEAVQMQACMAVRNIVSRSREFCDAFLQLGAEELINNARHHKPCEDQAKAALRDLGCHVELKELWKGEKGTLEAV